MSFSSLCNTVFLRAVQDYHVENNVRALPQNPYERQDIAHLLYQKNWIDSVQWHLEDLIRDPQIDPVAALELKREIDASNQRRTDMVEYLDAHFLNQYKSVQAAENASVNTESPAWALDRLSILALKIFHMQEESTRRSATQAHREACTVKLHILCEQRTDLSAAIDELLEDIAQGKKYMKVYKQMKMYNDAELNPVLYQSTQS